jgi:hypothetical protein
MLPHSVCHDVTFKLPKKTPEILESKRLSDKEPYRLQLKYKDVKEQKDEKTFMLQVLLAWNGHYDEADINVEFPITLGANSTTRYCLGYTPSLESWDMKIEKVLDSEKKLWSPLMHSLMGTTMATEKKSGLGLDLPLPEIKNISVIDDDEDMKSSDESEEKGSGVARPHPKSLWTASAVCRNDKDEMLMYIFGGAPVAKTKEPMGISAYDVKKNVWLPARVDEAKLPFATEERWGHSATVCPQGSSNIYLIGGWDSSCQYGDLTIYDAKKNELSQVATKDISPRAGHSAVCVGHNIYVFGGAICKGGPYKFYNDVQVLDTKTKSWKELTTGVEKPAPRSQHSCLPLGDSHLLVLGGYTGGALLDDVWSLDLKEAKWRRLLITSEEKGPKGWSGLSTSEFRVRPATHTSALIRWENGVGQVLVSGFSGSLNNYLLTVRPTLGTMEWKLVKSSLSTSPVGHSYVTFSKTGVEGEGVTVVSFGGLLNEKGGEPGTGRTNSYLRLFDIV